MKKVLYVATVDVHIKAFHLPYLKLLHDNGFAVHVATNGNENFENCDKKYQISIKRNPFNLSNIKAIRELKKIIENEKYDIVHCHTPMGAVVARIAAINARKKYKTKIIYTAHGFHFYKGAPILNWILFYFVEWYLSKFTDCLITINEEDYNLASNKFNKRCKDIQYIPGVGIEKNKLIFEMSNNEKIELRKSLGLSANDFVIIYPAEISKRKRQLWLLNSIKNLLRENSNIHLLLPGKDSLNGICQGFVKKEGLEHQVHFLGFRNDIPKLLKISNLEISVAKQEGLPVNVLEAMFVGLPIIVTNCRGNRDLIEDGVNGFVIGIDDSTKLQNAIKRIVNDSSVVKPLNDKELQKYTCDNIRKKLLKIYKI